MPSSDSLFLGGLLVIIASSFLGLAKAKDAAKAKSPYFLILGGALALLVTFVLRRL